MSAISFKTLISSARGSVWRFSALPSGRRYFLSQHRHFSKWQNNFFRRDWFLIPFPESGSFKFLPALFHSIHFNYRENYRLRCVNIASFRTRFSNHSALMEAGIKFVKLICDFEHLISFQNQFYHRFLLIHLFPLPSDYRDFARTFRVADRALKFEHVTGRFSNFYQTTLPEKKFLGELPSSTSGVEGGIYSGGGGHRLSNARTAKENGVDGARNKNSPVCSERESIYTLPLCNSSSLPRASVRGDTRG